MLILKTSYNFINEQFVGIAQAGWRVTSLLDPATLEATKVLPQPVTPLSVTFGWSCSTANREKTIHQRWSSRKREAINYNNEARNNKLNKRKGRSMALPKYCWALIGHLTIVLQQINVKQNVMLHADSYIMSLALKYLSLKPWHELPSLEKVDDFVDYSFLFSMHRFALPRTTGVRFLCGNTS